MTARRTKTAKTAAPKKTAAKKPAKPATGEEDTLDFARTVARAVQANLAAIQKHPVGKKQLPASRLARFNKQISAASTAMTSHQLQKVGAKGATANEGKLRLALIDQITTVRDAVSTLEGVDKETARAFGQGARLSRDTNADALLLASQQQQAFENAKYADAATEAGISAQQITAIMVARRALSGAASTQANVKTGKKGLGLDKKAMIKALSKETTSLRRVAKIVFKANSKVLATFAPAPKKPAKKRKPKPATAAPVIATAAPVATAAAPVVTAAASNGAPAASNQPKV